MERTAIVQAFQACGGCAPVPPTLAAAGLGSLRFGFAEAAVSQAARLILRPSLSQALKLDPRLGG